MPPTRPSLAGSVRKVTRESRTKQAMSKYERKLRLMSRYADDTGRLGLVLSHGEYQENAIATKFTVPDGQLIVFVSKTGVYLPQAIIDRSFYDIFGSVQGVSNLLKKGTNVPWYLKGFKKRTYGPGDQCPNLTLHMKDPAWRGMGIHALPLKAPLSGPGAPPGAYNGQTKKLRDIAGRGVLFVVACRAVVGREQSPEYVHAPRYTLRPRLAPEKVLQKFDKKVDLGASAEVRRARKQLLARADLGTNWMNVDGLPRRGLRDRRRLAGVMRKRASAMRRTRASQKKRRV